MSETISNRRMLEARGVRFEHDEESQTIFARELDIVNAVLIGFYLTTELDRFAIQSPEGISYLTPNFTYDRAWREAQRRRDSGEQYVFGPTLPANRNFSVHVNNVAGGKHELVAAATADNTAASPRLGFEELRETFEATLSKVRFE